MANFGPAVKESPSKDRRAERLRKKYYCRVLLDPGLLKSFCELSRPDHEQKFELLKGYNHVSNKIQLLSHIV